MLQKTKIIAIIVLVLVFLVGMFIGTKLSRKVATTSGNQPDTFQAGWDAAKARLSQSPLGMSIPAGREIKDISGTIQKINGNQLTVKINPLEPLADPTLDTRVVTVDSNTKITLSTPKDPTEFQKEVQDFQDKVKQQQQETQTNPSAPQTPITPPISYNKKNIGLLDLKINQQVEITASADIKDAKEFTATQIDAQEVTPTTTVPAA